MTTHKLKTWHSYYGDVESGRKRVEIRKDDRRFEVGDTLVLREYVPGEEVGISYGAAVDPGVRGYTGKSCSATVTHVLDGGRFGLLPGYVALSIELIEEDW